ncbi:hypothetical protein I7I48_03654 [Histoplasma ohiense]|nr:hypothetical protein I7I48_03654 [Histoplasma ohiense (nom. inval.)]
MARHLIAQLLNQKHKRSVSTFRGMGSDPEPKDKLKVHSLEELPRCEGENMRWTLKKHESKRFYPAS